MNRLMKKIMITGILLMAFGLTSCVGSAESVSLYDQGLEVVEVMTETDYAIELCLITWK